MRKKWGKVEENRVCVCSGLENPTSLLSLSLQPSGCERWDNKSIKHILYASLYIPDEGSMLVSLLKA